jgi:hypothetical protein
MKCKKCNEKYPANINEPAPGGSNSPGVFFVFNVLLILAGFVFIALRWKIWFFILGLGANILIYISFLVDNGIKGVSCPKCLHKNWIYPWSL